MQKIFCDICGRELNEQDNVSMYSLVKDIPKTESYRVCVSITSSGASKKLDICKYCVIDLVKELDDRPKERICCEG